MSRAFAVVALCAVGCASAPVPPRPLPSMVAPEQVPPAPGPPTIPAAVALYEDKHVRKGMCPGLPAGILVSPANYALRYWQSKDRERLLAEALTIGRLRTVEKEAAAAFERACLARTAELEAAVRRAERVSLWKAAALVGFGLLGGAVVAILARPVRP